jgi:predicted secreted protein
MKRSILMGLAALAILTLAASAEAALCGKCKGRMFPMAMGKCSQCPGATSTIGYKLCRTCGKKSAKCQACQAKLGGGVANPDGPKAEVFKARRWGGKFPDIAMRRHAPKQGFVADKAAWTKLWKAWRKEAVPTVDFANELVVVQTVAGPNMARIMTKLEPSGNLRVMAASTRMGGPGFGYGMLTVARKGVRTVNGSPVPPASGAAAAITLTAADSGKTVKATVGQTIVVKLKGNPTTGYSWAVTNAGGPALAAVGKIDFKSGAKPGGMVGVGGMFVATFKAVRTGTATIELQYRRPWEKGKAPAETFKADIVVTTKSAGKQGIRGQVLKLTGNHMPGPGIGIGGGGRGATKPLSVPVYVFKGSVKVHAAPNAKHPQLLKTVRSDAKGNYSVALDPGVYTVVALIDGKLYLNSFTGAGAWSTVTVKKGAWSTWTIRDTSGAAF